MTRNVFPRQYKHMKNHWTDLRTFSISSEVEVLEVSHSTLNIIHLLRGPYIDRASSILSAKTFPHRLVATGLVLI
jgi:hypothetical protein